MSTIYNVIQKPRYAFIAAIIFITLSALFWLLTFYFTPTPLPKYIEMYGLSFTYITITLGFVIAILTGLNTSLVLCRKQMTGSLGFKKGAGSSACSAFVGAIASGCPLCTAPLLGVFGLGGALALFPFQGLELKTAAIIILGISLYYTSKNVRIACKL
ncbi:hypothetical protein [Candidatus Nitrosotalea okcheonensis]|uniref:Uncharacterized protein n=1 Tax=Candidatus Nitrosotalea okcheonensis TaxID=1903276 RepID=A0A2H1FFM3_9ARCH|nr:hypothetical protein [Candidatus Nitrosotalea okcheonensis]MDE1729059.1 hypothetical protein [Nitrososphaerota archaeon]MDE1832708.1 hypothetical protein [Nitrososphaerota archaeon]MDE1877705.1 hypothetical protein [Nitrososphaerota archaeon]SMH71563.1 conserved membrane protein of unknown function [Candidatus Nitrosotalea okcheonensis]